MFQWHITIILKMSHVGIAEGTAEYAILKVVMVIPLLVSRCAQSTVCTSTAYHQHIEEEKKSTSMDCTAR